MFFVFRALNGRENPGPCTVFPCHARAGPDRSLRGLLMGSVASSFQFLCPHQPCMLFPLLDGTEKLRRFSTRKRSEFTV